MTVLITANASLPASMQRRAFSADIGLVGRQLGDERFARHAAAGLHDLGRHVGVVAERHAAFLDVGTRDVDLDGIDGRLVEAARDLDVLLDRGARNIGNETGFGKVELREDSPHDVLDARILKSNGIQHAGRCLVDAVRRVPQPRVLSRALEHDGARVAIRKPLDARVFLPEAHASRQEHNGRAEIEPAEVESQRVADGVGNGGHGGHYGARARPSVAS